MSESHHTPGPWRVNSIGPARFIYDGTPLGWAIADVKTFHGKHDTGQTEANARLIAAAPDLVSIAKRWAALDGGAWAVERHAREKAELLADTRAVIAKAEGRADD